MGFSLGTAPTIDLAAKNLKNIVGVILISPFTSGLGFLRLKSKTKIINCLESFQKFFFLYY